MPGTVTRAGPPGEDVAAVPTWISTVTAVADVSDRFRQVTVAGGLDGFVPGEPDQFVHVLAPPRPGCELAVDRSFSWEAHRDMDPEVRPVGAYYTIRRWHPEHRSIDLWALLHGHGGDGEGWARRARPGDPVALWGPRDTYAPPPGTEHLLLTGDETAVPAIAAILESLDGSQRASAIVHGAGSSRALLPPSRAPLDVTWLAPTREDPNPLLSAVAARSTELTSSSYVWGGGESRDVSAVRRHVRDVVGLSADQVCLTGYWRRDREVVG